jgi:uncharacterized protein
MESKHQKIKEIVQKELAHSHHDLEHVERVHDLCIRIAREEPKVDMDVLRTAALLHDVARIRELDDTRGTVEHATLGAKMAEEILRKLNYENEKIAQIKHCIAVHRYRRNRKPRTVEAKILFDADKLDALGAVGIARCFLIAGRYDQRIYSDIPLKQYVNDNVVARRKTRIQLKDISKHSPNLEFELKLKHIPERLYTRKAKEIAEQRLVFMEEFFNRLKAEVKGKQ